MDIFSELLLKIGVLSVFLFMFFYILYKIYQWARGKPKGAFVLFSILPLMSFFPIPPPIPKSMENVEQKQHKQKEESGDPVTRND